MPALAVVPDPDPAPRRTAFATISLEVAFVNNMSDAALRQTERLFIRLLGTAATGISLGVRRYRPGLRGDGEPGEAGALGYLPLEELLDRGADAVVVTGAEPRCRRLTDEASWNELCRLLEWVAAAERPAFLSCLAAHAALHVYDGLERRRLPTKCSGVFPQQVAAGHALGRGLPPSVAMPHSRYNDVPLHAVHRAGYDPVLWSPEVGWTVATRRNGRSTLVLAQGHPEYSGTTLLREYRRDVGRYLDGSGVGLPVLPRRCIDGPKAVALRRFQEQLAGGRRDPSRIEEFPVDISALHARAPWAGPAARLVRNWLEDAARVAAAGATNRAARARGGRRPPTARRTG